MTPFNYFGDLEGASSLLNEAEKKLRLEWENGSHCLTEDDIEHLENQLRIIRAQVSKIQSIKEKHKVVAIFRAERSK